MEVNAKILLAMSEYERLLSIEKKYNQMLQEKTQDGGGKSSKDFQIDQNKPLSQIIEENKQKQSLETPVAAVLPSVTNYLEAEAVTSNTPDNNSAKEHGSYKQKVKKDMPWYYIG